MERQGPSRRAWVVLSACLTALFFLYTYNDNVGITMHAMNVWSALRDGEILNFYPYNDGVAPPDDDFHAVPIVYGFLAFLLIAIWNLPLWLLHEVGGINVFTSVVALGWMKTINVVFAVGTAVLVQRVSRRLAPGSRAVPWAAFVFLSSGFLVSAVFVMGQFDAIHTFFTVLGLYHLLQGRRRAFVAAFAVAIALKWFPLFVLLPVLLLVEKRPTRVVLALGGALSLALVLKVPFAFAPNPSAEIGSDLINAMVLGNSLPLSVSGVPVFPLAFMLVCLACYVHRPAGEGQLQRTVFYAGFAGLATFFVSAPAYPYWFVLLCPFVVVLWSINPTTSKVSLSIETAATAAMLVLHQIHFYWTYDLSIVRPMVLPRILGSVDSLAHPVSPLSLYTRIGLADRAPVLAAAFTAGTLALLVLYRPRTDRELAAMTDHEDGRLAGVVYGRAAVMVALMLAPAAAYLYSRFVYGAA